MMNENNGQQGLKGSKLYLQNCINNNPDKLSELIISASPSLTAFTGDIKSIVWKSPLVKDKFHEYGDDFFSALELEEGFINEVEEKRSGFWPKNGPQWDGIAIIKNSDGEKGVLLIEAKAHTSETNSNIGAKSIESISKIKESIARAQGYYNIMPNDWTQTYYQLGNRIAYLYFMNVILNIPTWLVLINFVNGNYKPTTIEQWLKHYNNIYGCMGIKHNNSDLLNRIIHVYPEIENDNLKC